jgi:hypothetical protein
MVSIAGVSDALVQIVVQTALCGCAVLARIIVAWRLHWLPLRYMLHMRGWHGMRASRLRMFQTVKHQAWNAIVDVV